MSIFEDDSDQIRSIRFIHHHYLAIAYADRPLRSDIPSEVIPPKKLTQSFRSVSLASQHNPAFVRGSFEAIAKVASVCTFLLLEDVKGALILDGYRPVINLVWVRERALLPGWFSLQPEDLSKGFPLYKNPRCRPTTSPLNMAESMAYYDTMVRLNSTFLSLNLAIASLHDLDTDLYCEKAEDDCKVEDVPHNPLFSNSRVGVLTVCDGSLSDTEIARELVSPPNVAYQQLIRGMIHSGNTEAGSIPAGHVLLSGTVLRENLPSPVAANAMSTAEWVTGTVRQAEETEGPLPEWATRLLASVQEYINQIDEHPSNEYRFWVYTQVWSHLAAGVNFTPLRLWVALDHLIEPPNMTVRPLTPDVQGNNRDDTYVVGLTPQFPLPPPLPPAPPPPGEVPGPPLDIVVNRAFLTSTRYAPIIRNHPDFLYNEEFTLVFLLNPDVGGPPGTLHVKWVARFTRAVGPNDIPLPLWLSRIFNFVRAVLLFGDEPPSREYVQDICAAVESGLSIDGGVDPGMVWSSLVNILDPLTLDNAAPLHPGLRDLNTEWVASNEWVESQD